MNVENCYFPVDFIIIDMKNTKNFTNAPIILGRLFLDTAKGITNWGKGEVIFQVGESAMKVISFVILCLHLSRGLDARGCRLLLRRGVMPWW